MAQQSPDKEPQPDIVEPEAASGQKIEPEAPRQAPGRGMKKQKKGMMKNPLVWVVIVLILAAAGVWAAQRYFDVSIPGLSFANPVPENAVAVVNGEAISEKVFNTRVSNQQQTTEAQGGSVDSEQLRQSVLENMVNETLIAQQARKEGITPQQEAVEQQVNNLMEQFDGEEGLAQELDKRGLTREDLIGDIERQNIVQQFVSQYAAAQGVSVSDEEVETAYEQAKAQAAEGAEIPALDEVANQLRQRLQQQKLIGAVNTLIEQLRQDATIQTEL